MRQDPSMWNNETNRYEYLGVWKYRIEKESMVESNGWIEFIRRYAVCVRIVLSVREIATTRIGSKYVTSGRKRGSSSLQTIALESVCLTRNRSSAASESKAQKGNGRDGRDYRGRGGKRRETDDYRRATELIWTSAYRSRTNAKSYGSVPSFSSFFSPPNSFNYRYPPPIIAEN